RNLIVLDACDVLDNAFAVGCPRIDAEGEVSSRRGHLRPLLPQSSSGAGLGHDRCERGFAYLKRIAPQVVAVQFDQVEGVEEYVAVIAPITNAVEGCDAVVVADDCLAVDDTRPAV